MGHDSPRRRAQAPTHEKPRPGERYEGVDADFLASDTWAEEARGVACPKCGYVAGPADIRCARCNALLLMGCSGSCASCGSRKCARRV